MKLSAPASITKTAALIILVLAFAALAAACGAEPTATLPPPTTMPGPTAAADPATAAADPATTTAVDATTIDAATATAAPTAAPASEALPPCDGRRGGSIGNCAPEFSGINAWINSDPLTMQELRGRVVLIDFWTYTCINCIRTYPHLKAWHSRYSDDGLVIIGVHSPEFEFEADYDNVVEASENDGIIWPVAQDNEFEAWRSYSNRYWPAKYLVDKDGVVRYTHFGEGDYAETETMIRELLLDAGAQLNDGNLPLPSDQMLDPAFQSARDAEITRELYAGYLRGRNDLAFGGGGYVGQDEYYNTRDAVADLQVPDELEPHQIYFEGPWYIGPESSRHGAESTGYEDYLALVYSARSVNAVLTSDSGEPYRVRLTVGGEYLTDENKGADVTIGPDGESYIVVTEPKIYNIIESPEWMRRQELHMRSDSPDFGLFAFTFGSYEKEAS